MLGLFLYSLYSGQLFFVAVLAFLAAAALDLAGSLDRRPGGRRVAGVLALLAIALAALGAPPLPSAIAIPALAATLVYAFAGFGARKILRRSLAAPAVAGCLLAMAVELPYAGDPACPAGGDTARSNAGSPRSTRRCSFRSGATRP